MAPPSTGPVGRVPGPLLLIVDHDLHCALVVEPCPDTDYPTPAEVATGLELDPARWPVLRANLPRRRSIAPGGDTATVTDHIPDRPTG